MKNLLSNTTISGLVRRRISIEDPVVSPTSILKYEVKSLVPTGPVTPVKDFSQPRRDFRWTGFVQDSPQDTLIGPLPRTVL